MLHLPTKIKIGTRASRLAITQVNEIKKLLLQNSSLTQDQIEIVQIATSGDKIQDRNLAEIGGKGLFIKELEEALLAKKIDLAVHSAKDVPPVVAKSTCITAFTKRKDARDYFISKNFNSIDELPIGAVIGTSSARRKAILLRLRPDLKIVNFRGNVDTRLSKLEDGKVDATILALCGLSRLEKIIDKKNILELETMLPAAGQGSLALQIRQDDTEIAQLIAKINHRETQICVEVERRFLQELGASCKTPVAAYCVIENSKLHFKTIIFDFNGEEIFATDDQNDLEKGEDLALNAALQVKERARKLLDKVCGC